MAWKSGLVDASYGQDAAFGSRQRLWYNAGHYTALSGLASISGRIWKWSFPGWQCLVYGGRSVLDLLYTLSVNVPFCWWGTLNGVRQIISVGWTSFSMLPCVAQSVKPRASAILRYCGVGNSVSRPGAHCGILIVVNWSFILWSEAAYLGVRVCRRLCRVVRPNASAFRVCVCVCRNGKGG
jgi:hypothetical protein